MTNIIWNHAPRRPEPVTEADFKAEMAAEALKDILIFGYHMTPFGVELTMADLEIDPLILDPLRDIFREDDA